jgi:hypothetical protein
MQYLDLQNSLILCNWIFVPFDQISFHFSHLPVLSKENSTV